MAIKIMCVKMKFYDRTEELALLRQTALSKSAGMRCFVNTSPHNINPTAA